MQAIITDGKGSYYRQEINMIELAPWQALCRIDACATCSGTDQKLIKGLFDWADKYPAILGHESVGTVIECGSKVKKFRVGDRVLRPAAALPGMQIADLHSWMGGFAEYGIVGDPGAMPEDILSVDPFRYTCYQQLIPADLKISQADATLLVMLKEVAAACKNAEITSNDKVLVLGGGAVAQAMCFFASFHGAKVIVAARRDEPIERCCRSGAGFAVDLRCEDLTEKVMQITNNSGVNKVMDAAGNLDLTVQAADLLTDKGCLSSYAALEGGRFPVERVKNRRSWKMAKNRLLESDMHEEVIAMVKNKKLDPAEFYTHKADFCEFEKIFPMLEAKTASKIVFTMN